VPFVAFRPAASAPADARGGPPHEADDPERASLARYIADMVAELSKMAQGAEMPLLSYFLDLARIEAEAEARAGGEGPLGRDE
jgi:hypothetical protein